jgi:hypothetical protein
MGCTGDAWSGILFLGFLALLIAGIITGVVIGVFNAIALGDFSVLIFSITAGAFFVIGWKMKKYKDENLD